MASRKRSWMSQRRKYVVAGFTFPTAAAPALRSAIMLTRLRPVVWSCMVGEVGLRESARLRV